MTVNDDAAGHPRIDPRTKFILLLLCVIAVSISPSLEYGILIVLAVALLGAVLHEWKFAAAAAGVYTLLIALTYATVAFTSGFARGTLMGFFGAMHKAFPCAMLGILIIRTTKVGEFLAAMNRSFVPKKFVIATAIMLRYFPAIQEDWRAIQDAMRMRDVNPSLMGLLTKPVQMIQCVYVPLMMAASKAADELSIASLTRGIENPAKRTSLIQFRPGWLDAAAGSLFIAILALGVAWG